MVNQRVPCFQSNYLFPPTSIRMNLIAVRSLVHPSAAEMPFIFLSLSLQKMSVSALGAGGGEPCMKGRNPRVGLGGKSLSVNSSFMC